MRTGNAAPSHPRPFVFNPANLHPPRSVRPLNLSAGTPRPLLNLAGAAGTQPGERVRQAPPHDTARKARAGDLRPGTVQHTGPGSPVAGDRDLQQRPPCTTSTSLGAERETSAASSGKSVVIRDSSDDEFSVDLELPDDILGPSRVQPSDRAKDAAPNTQAPPEREPAQPFDPDLDAASALAALKATRELLARLADDAAQLIGDMESMASSYSSAVDRTARLQLRHKQHLVAQWEETKRNSQMLLASVKAKVSSDHT